MAMTHLFLASVSLEVLLFAVHARIEIYPATPVVEVGSKVNLSCRILEDSMHHTADNLVWYRNSHLLPISNHFTVNISVVTLRRVGFADSGNYSCCLPLVNKCNDTHLTVGVPPGPVNEFRCISRNIIEYWCEWQPGADTHLEDTYQFYFKRKLTGESGWQECPDYLSKGVNSCFVSISYNPGIAQSMKLVTTNQLGSYDNDHVSFWPETQTIPYPPSNVVVLVEDNKTIMVRWTFPDEWDTVYDPFGLLLNYKLRFKPQAANWTEVQESSQRHYSLRNLKSFTMYCVQVAAIIETPYNYNNYWSDWSQIECATTKKAESQTTRRMELYRSAQHVVQDRTITSTWTQHGRISLHINNNLPIIIPVVSISITIHVVGVILYVIYYHTVKKVKDLPEPRFIVNLEKMQKDLRNNRLFVVEKETFDSLCNKNVPVNLTHSESTNSEVLPSPDHIISDVNDLLTQDSSPLPSLILDTNDDSCHNFTLSRSEDSVSDDMENKGVVLFCNSNYIQKTVPTNKSSSISCYPNDNAHTVNIAEALVVPEPNAKDYSVSLLNQKEDFTQNTNMVEQLQVAKIHADNPHTQRDKITFIRLGQSSDNIENAPYFKKRMSPEPSLPPVISHNSDRKQLHYFKLSQLASIRDVNNRSEQCQVDRNANTCMNFAKFRNNSDQGVKTDTTVSNNAHNKTDLSVENCSQMADLAANLLQQEQQTKESTTTNPADAKHLKSDSSKLDQYLGYVHVGKSGKISTVDGHSVEIQPNLN